MTRQEVDTSTFTGEISASGSTELELDTGRAEDVVLFVDDGTTGGSPASYTVSVDVYQDEYEDWQRLVDVGASTDLSKVFDAYSGRMRLTVTDDSAAAATRRITAQSYRQVD